ncbi:MAG TPA: XRE family transcriptional regulator [Polyangiaceae bacterium]|nr:XRE family transcriptional regulator [Polyangiaceae bacterium]
MPRPTSRARSKIASAQPGAARPRRPTVAGLGDEVGAAQLGRRVAESLRQLRQERRLSLDQLAEASGVSRAALSQIESARTNPTLTILWKVAVGLGVPFQALLGTGEGGRTRVLRAADMVPLRSADGRMESRLLSPAGADRVEIYELRFQPKGSLRSEPHGPHSTETVIVLTGVLRVSVGDESHELRAGDSLFFEADVRHAYENPTLRETRCIDVIGYGHG